ncbi:hypothetical protein G9A89_002503 [Geosiphon pyriformis]|nr:hypothetical protein G9A89_002503 [Geosiphon pyriformis]
MASTLPTLCFDEIFDALDNHTPTLYACIFINRYWCQHAIHRLWQEPFKIISGNISCLHLIDISMACFSREEKEKIGNRLPTIAQQHPLFPYTKFLRHLPIESLSRIISDWCEMRAGNSSENLVLNTFCRHLVRCSSKITQLSSDFVYAIAFNQNNWDHSSWDVFSFEGAENSFRKLEILFLLEAYPPQMLLSAAKVSHEIQSLVLTLSSQYSDTNVAQERADSLSILLLVQKKLSHVGLAEFNGNPNLLFHGLNQCSSSLTKLEFIDFNFNRYPLIKLLKKCVNLKFLLIQDCRNFADVAEEDIQTNSISCLESIEINNTTYCVNFAQALAKNAGHCLKKWVIIKGGFPSSELVKSYITHLVNLAHFECSLPELDSILLVARSFNHLKTLHITRELSTSPIEAEEFLPRLGSILSATIIDLAIDLNLKFSPASLEHFFKNTEAKFKRLSFTNSALFSDKHLAVVRKYASHLYELNINNAYYVTRSAFRDAKIFIPVIKINYRELRDDISN